MKRNLIALLILLISTVSFSQESEFTKMMREMYQSEFIDIMNENMELNKAEDAIFQPILDDFMVEIISVMDDKLATQGKYASYFEGMNDENAKKLLTEVWTNVSNYNKVLNKYSKKVEKALGPQSGIRFYLIVQKVQINFEFSKVENLPLLKK